MDSSDNPHLRSDYSSRLTPDAARLSGLAVIPKQGTVREPRRLPCGNSVSVRLFPNVQRLRLAMRSYCLASPLYFTRALAWPSAFLR